MKVFAFILIVLVMLAGAWTECFIVIADSEHEEAYFTSVLFTVAVLVGALIVWIAYIAAKEEERK